MESKSSVKHTGQSFIIEVSTYTPAVLHSGLMKGITAGIKAHITSESITPVDADNMHNLVKFLEQIIPDEKHLREGYRTE